MTSNRILELKGELNRLGVNADLLILLFVGPNDMVIGEEVPWADNSVYERQGLPDRVMLKNPKRFQRLTVPTRQPNGEVGFNNILQFGDFDYISGGNVEFRHQGGFSLSWLDEGAQIEYLKVYINFLGSKQIAKAQEAGIHIPNGPISLPRR